MHPNDVVEEFGRRHRAIKRTLLVAVIAWGAAAVSVAAVSAGVLSQWAPLALTALGIAALLPYWRAGSRYSCPACGTKPTSGDGEPGALLNPPPHCERCGVRLRH